MDPPFLPPPGLFFLHFPSHVCVYVHVLTAIFPQLSLQIMQNSRYFNRYNTECVCQRQMLPIDLKDSFEKLTLGYLLFSDSKDKMGRDNFLTQKLKHLKKKSICAH